jgi:hypothetical protein
MGRSYGPSLTSYHPDELRAGDSCGNLTARQVIASRMHCQLRRIDGPTRFTVVSRPLTNQQRFGLGLVGYHAHVKAAVDTLLQGQRVEERTG